MIANTAKAIEATKALVAAVPFLVAARQRKIIVMRWRWLIILSKMTMKTR